MKILQKKKIASIFAIILMLTIAFSFAFSLPTTSAARSSYDDIAYLSLAPNTLGLGQNCIITFWCDKLPPTAQGEYGDRFYFDINIIKPDGTNDTILNVESDPVGAGYTNYVATETGTYTVQAIMRQHVIDGGASRGKVSPAGPGWWPGGTPVAGLNPIGVVFNSAVSQAETLTVTTELVPRYVETPLPNDYWTRPIYDTNRGWGAYAMGQWLGASELVQYGNNGRYDPYSTGPASSHILWTKPYFNGGIAGGVATINSSSSDNSYYSGQSYESFGGPQFVLNGKIYWSSQTTPREGYYEVDLYTGQTLYWANTTGPVVGVGTGQTSTGNVPVGAPAFGQVLVYDSPNQHGTQSFYWVTSTPGGTYSTGLTASYTSNKWELYDSFTNQRICAIDNVTWTDTHSGRSVTKGATGTSAVGIDGSILRYNIVNLGTTAAPQWYLQCWNTTQVIMYPFYVIHETGSGTNTNWLFRPNFNQTYDGRYGLSINASINLGLLSGATIRQVIPDDRIIIIYAGSNNGSLVLPARVVAINLKPGSVGQELYSYNFTTHATVGDTYGQNEQFSGKDVAFGGVNSQANIFWYTNPMTREYYIYELSTGTFLWQTQAPQFSFYGMGTGIVYKGMWIDCGGYGGTVRAFEAKTGTLLWNWTAPSVGIDETAYQYTPTYLGFLSGDGLLYLYSNEHSVNNPIRRDAQIWCLNVTSGKMVWMLTNWPSSAPILVDQRLLVVDSHDNELYCFGKGPSATTVSAPQTIPALGSSIILTGTVTDQTPYGRRTITDNLDFSLKGTPAIGDASMDAWMEYMFHQRPKPTNAIGVDVSLTAIDPNGNYIPIGTTTSDSNGNYGIVYTPEVPGTYQILASFAGSNAYGPSTASTYLAVGDSAATPAPTAAPAESTADTYFVPAIAGLFVLIIIVAIVLALLMLRKK
jgi:outer membrane protein assembly factor BamB